MNPKVVPAEALYAHTSDQATNATSATYANYLNTLTITLSGDVSGSGQIINSNNLIIETTVKDGIGGESSIPSALSTLTKEILITNSNTTGNGYGVTWDGTSVTVTHNLSGKVFGTLFDENNNQILIGINYVDDNNVSINLNGFTLNQNDVYILLLTTGITGSYLNENTVNELSMVSLINLNIVPESNKVYTHTLSSNDVITFSNVVENKIFSFRLYLTMPSEVVSFTMPTNIIWERIPDFSVANALYMFVFEWNPILNKWLGNQIWDTVVIGE